MAYRCEACGFQAPKWLGRCPRCGRWNSLIQDDVEGKSPRTLEVQPRPLTEVPLPEAVHLPSGLREFDRVLGGGVIPGSLVLLGGEPGIGKSTLLLQVAGALTRTLKPVLYVSGEEAEAQIKLRARRLGLEDAELWLLTEQRLAGIEAALKALKPKALVVDSVQSVLPGEGREGLGTTWQVGQVTFSLNGLAKRYGMPVFLIGHVTKAGELAGPKAIEHLVDVVLYLEGTRHGELRLLRSVKNRYGSTAELGVFQMGPRGLVDLENPSKFFAGRQGPPLPGSVVVPALEGTRPLLLELQALVASNYGHAHPQRRATGLDVNRLILMIAVIEKRLGLRIGGDDVYLNVAGGLSVRETACDLGTCLAIVSSFKSRPLPADWVVVGEVGLSGEVRPVPRLQDRLREAVQLGYKGAIVPAGEAKLKARLRLQAVRHLGEAVEALA